MSDIDYAALNQSIDTTWGRSSTPRTSSYSVKFTFAGEDRLLVSYAVIVNFGTERQMIEMKRAYADEAGAVIADAIKRIKSVYKDLTGNTLSMKIDQRTISDSVEIISFNVHNAKRTAYFRRKAFFDVG